MARRVSAEKRMPVPSVCSAVALSEATLEAGEREVARDERAVDQRQAEGVGDGAPGRRGADPVGADGEVRAVAVERRRPGRRRRR